MERSPYGREMLSASGERRFTSSGIRSAVLLERQFGARVLHRDRLRFDSGYRVPARAPSGYAHLYVVERGACQIGDEAPRVGRQAYLFAGAHAPRFRAWGAPNVVVELCVRSERMNGGARGCVRLTDDVWEACAALAHEPSVAALEGVLHALGAAGMVAPGLGTSIVRAEPERFTRLWRVVAPSVIGMAPAAPAKELARVIERSPRQVARDMGELVRTFGLFGIGYRATMRVIRLRTAALLLSSPDLSVTAVARFVGYGSVVAMGRAFRDAGLPSPRDVQAAVRYPRDDLADAR
jgi:AraC-like DNA-binding protein